MRENRICSVATRVLRSPTPALDCRKLKVVHASAAYGPVVSPLRTTPTDQSAHYESAKNLNLFPFPHDEIIEGRPRRASGELQKKLIGFSVLEGLLEVAIRALGITSGKSNFIAFVCSAHLSAPIGLWKYIGG